MLVTKPFVSLLSPISWEFVNLTLFLVYLQEGKQEPGEEMKHWSGHIVDVTLQKLKAIEIKAPGHREV